MFTQLCFLSLLPFCVQVGSAMNWATDSAYTSQKAEDLRKTTQVRVASVTCSAVSLCASVIGFYWFFRMDKLFRHRLIMILLYGDLMRGFWYFTIAIYSFIRGGPKTETALCQVSGFFIQLAVETSDYGVLVISVHSALQVFRPASRGESDGLHHYRYYIYAGAFILPTIMASLAFIRSEWGYMLQGAYCVLPIRPFWYLLALAWIPRYLIVLTIFGLAIAIYSYVGFEFKSYESVNQSLVTPLSVMQSGVAGRKRDVKLADVNSDTDIHGQVLGRRASSIAHEILSSPSPRRASVTVVDGSEPATASGSRSSVPTVPAEVFHPFRPSIATTSRFRDSSRDTYTTLSSFNPRPHRVRIIDGEAMLTMASAPALLGQDPSSSHEAFPMAPGRCNMPRQRRRINRQLRLMFVYPIVYAVMYIVPFINHCLQYSDHYAAHPIFAIRILAIIFLASLGLVNCIIFSIREKPWRSIPTSNGTLWGSFTIWSYIKSDRDGSFTSGLQESLKAKFSVKGLGGSSGFGRIRNSVRTSASDSDQTRIATAQAKQRLEMEKQERSKAFKEKMTINMGRRPTLEGMPTSRHVLQLKNLENKDDGDKGKGKAQ